MGKKLDAALAEREEIERDPDRIARPDTITSRGGRNRVLQIRLSDAEYDALAKIAGDQPASAVARDHLLRLINGTAPEVVAGGDVRILLQRASEMVSYVANGLPESLSEIKLRDVPIGMQQVPGETSQARELKRHVDS